MAPLNLLLVFAKTIVFSLEKKRDLGKQCKNDGMRDSHKIRAGMRDKDPPFQTLNYQMRRFPLGVSILLVCVSGFFKSIKTRKFGLPLF